MERKVLITKIHNRIVTSSLEDDKLVDIQCSQEPAGKVCYSLGDIYIGKVKNIVPNIHAAFIEIAPGVECYYAIEQNKNTIFTHKIGKKPLCIGDEVLVQISKEAVKTKVPTVTGNLNFTGRYAVLTVGNNRIGISSKITSVMRTTLQEIMKPYKSKSYGFIVRTNAQSITPEELIQEVEELIELYHHILTIAPSRTCYSCLQNAPSPYITGLKNLYKTGLTQILIEDSAIYQEVYQFLSEHQPEDVDKLTLYQDKLLPLHKRYSVEQVLTDALKEHVWLKSGGYLVIQPTEALTVIDVNTGKCIGKKDNNTYLNINIEAAKEVAIQLRLRNISGIIVIDFINLDKDEDMKQLLQVLSDAIKKDPIPTTFVDVTKLQLVELTRKKVRKPLLESYKSV
ncbi:MAG: ribonuclease E/G [Lachnospiraceae bacterium]